jgi:hypothetical protein
MAVITLSKPLRERLGDEAVDDFIEILNKVIEDQKQDILKFVEEKFERRLTEEISGVKSEIIRVKSELTTEITQVRSDFMEKHAETIRWMFIFWVGQVGVILGILFAFFKH